MARAPRLTLTEAEIAAPVVAHLEAKGYDVYQEVPCRTGRADIVALVNGEDWIVETKTTWSLDLLEQALARRTEAHRVFVAVPEVGDWRSRADLFRSLGIGTYCVMTPTLMAKLRCHIYSPERPAPQPGCPCGACDLASRPITVKLVCGLPMLHEPTWNLRDRIRPEHKTHAKAGSRSGLGVFHWTPWRETMQNLSDLVAGYPDGIAAVEAAKLVKHHYPNERTARSALIDWARRGRAPRVAAITVGQRVWFFPMRDPERLRAFMVSAKANPDEIERYVQIAEMECMSDRIIANGATAP